MERSPVCKAVDKLVAGLSRFLAGLYLTASGVYVTLDLFCSRVLTKALDCDPRRHGDNEARRGRTAEVISLLQRLHPAAILIPMHGLH